LYVPPVNAEASAETWIDVGECPVAADVLSQPPLESVTENGSDGMKLRIVRDSTLLAAAPAFAVSETFAGSPVNRAG
jgi:hypothetical protein